MNNSKINTYSDITLRIAELTNLKTSQEVELKNNLKEVYENFQLKNILKNTLKDMAKDKELRKDGFGAVSSMLTDMVVGRVFNKNNSVRGFITTLLIESLALPFIKNNKENIISFISNLIHKEKKDNG